MTLPIKSNRPSSPPPPKSEWKWGFAGASCAYTASMLAIAGVGAVSSFFVGALAVASVSFFAKVLKAEDVKGFLFGPIKKQDIQPTEKSPTAEALITKKIEPLKKPPARNE